ncbi:MAG: hypothetical protein JNJ73_03920 [Hyphomonadaceae bacterium]|nr:hypothetical protein [Hyphomonadaceae bacterium]
MQTLAVGAADIPWSGETAPKAAKQAAPNETFFNPVSPAPDLFPRPADEPAAAPARAKAQAGKAVAFNRGEAIVVVMGAAALGLLGGALIAFLIGAKASSVVAASLWLAFALALHLAAKTLTQLLRAGAWSQAALYAVHLFAFAPWPLAVLFAPPDTATYWIGLVSLLGTLWCFFMSSPAGRRRNAGPSGEIVYRICAHIMLMAGATALQAMMLAFAH